MGVKKFNDFIVVSRGWEAIHWQPSCFSLRKGNSMRLMLLALTFLMSFGAMASSGCEINDFLKSAEGKDKFMSLLERSKGLIISKLEEIGVEENQIHIKAVFPGSEKDLRATLEVNIKAKNLKAENPRIILSKVIRDEDCGLEVSVFGGELHNIESNKNFGSLGKVKEFIRL